MKTIKHITIAASLFFTTASLAGTVTLESPKYDNICKVQVTTGKDQTNKIVKTYSNVSKGFSVSGEDRLCYRRSAKPEQCDSTYTAWNCASRGGSGTSIIKLS